MKNQLKICEINLLSMASSDSDEPIQVLNSQIEKLQQQHKGGNAASTVKKANPDFSALQADDIKDTKEEHKIMFSPPLNFRSTSQTPKPKVKDPVKAIQKPFVIGVSQTILLLCVDLRWSFERDVLCR